MRNAFRNDEGACECHNYWRDEDCSIYAGLCDVKCSGGCYGPLDSDCVECGEHTYHDVSTNRCHCLIDWTGDDCSYYMGKCGPTCVGCDGPSIDDIDIPPDDDEFDEIYGGLYFGICKDCVPHAHREG